MAYLGVVAILVGGGAYGWITNIVKLAHGSFDPLTGMIVLRGIGILIAPLGVIMGYL